MERAPTSEFPVDRIIPEHFGDYQRLDEGQSGGMGTVYKVLNRRLNVERALKVLKQDLTMHPEAREAFVREAHFGAKLASGPHILPVHTVGTLQGWYFFEMDWVEGPNLHQYVQKKGRLDPWAALVIGTMICDALHFAHHAKIRQESGETLEGLFHRDIKPANILLEPKTGRMLLTDFGIARARDAARSRRDAYTAGTINYLTPEQIRAQPVDERSDIYQVGLVLYEILAGGQKAFPGEEDSGVTGRILDGTYESLDRHVRKLDPTVAQIVKRAMNRLPTRRYQTAEEMRQDIHRYLRTKYVDHDIQRAFERYLQTGQVPRKKGFWSPKRKRVAKYALAAILLAAVATVLIIGIPRYILLPNAQKGWEEARNTYRDVRFEWDRQPWDASRTESVNAQENEFRNPRHETRAYNRATALATALTARLSHDIDSVQQLWFEAKGEFDRLRSAVPRNAPADQLAERLVLAGIELDSLENLDYFIEAERAARKHMPPFLDFLNVKKQEFEERAERLRQAIDSKKARCQTDATGFQDVRKLEIEISSRVSTFQGQESYVQGVEWMREKHNELNRIRCGGVAGPATSFDETRPGCPKATEQIQYARDALGAFTAEEGWQEHQSSNIVPLDLAVLQTYMDETQSLLASADCDGISERTESVLQGVARLYAEWTEAEVASLGDCESDKEIEVPRTPGYRQRLDEMIPYEQENWADFQGMLAVARTDLHRCLEGLQDTTDWYEAGLQAWQGGRSADAETYLSRVGTDHINYRYSRKLLAHARAHQNKLDERTLRLYREAGPIVEGDLLALTNILQCYYWLDACDSVDAFFDHARALGQWSCDETEAEYRTALLYHIRCDYKRFRQAKFELQLGDEFWLRYGRSGISKCDRFEQCFPNSEQLEEIRDFREKFRL